MFQDYSSELNVDLKQMFPLQNLIKFFLALAVQWFYDEKL